MTVRWPAKRGDVGAAAAEVNDLSAAVTWANIPIANVPTGTSGTTVALGDHTHTGVYSDAAHVHEGTVIDATAVTDGYVLTADGAGNSAWEAPASGGLANVVEDLTPQLGGNLDPNSKNLTGTIASTTWTLPASGNFTFSSDGTGRVAFDLGTDGYWESNDGGTNVVQSCNNTDFRFSVTGSGFDTYPCYLTGFLDLRLDQPIKIKEQAAADADVTAYGQLWVRTATPNELWFTDDAGNDFGITPSVAEKTASYTLALTDSGHVIRFTGATGSKVCTIPANASVAFPIGTMIGITNDGSVTMTVAITTDTLTWGKDNTTGTRTLAAGADCVILKTTATTWKINGSALVT